MPVSVRQADRDAPPRGVEPVASHIRDFFGQKLLVIFCPRAAEAAIAELKAYESRADAFQRSGTWLIAVSRSNGVEPSAGSGAHVRLASDPDGLAFQMLAAGFPNLAEARDATVFLVDRDGKARHAWQGAGRVEEVLAAVRERP